MNKLLNITISLFILTISVSLRAQGGYTFTPILDGRFYAAEQNSKHTRGIMKGEFAPDMMAYYSKEELKELLVVPVAYEDVRLIKVFYQSAYFAEQYSFNAVKDGTYTVYNSQGKRILGPVSSAIGFQADCTSLPYHFVATQSPDGQGFDLNIIVPYYDPIVVRGPFEYAFYQEVISGDKSFYVIKAKKPGKEEFAFYDVVGNKISQDRMNAIADYYEKIGTGFLMKYDLARKNNEKDLDEQTKNLYLAALCGNPEGVRVVIEGNYLSKVFDQDFATLATIVQDAEALYYVGVSYLEGCGTEININSAKSCLQMADKLGYPLSKSKLSEIAAIETPVKLATGPQAAVDVMMESDKLRELAYKGNLEAIKIYCHQSLFFSFGSALNNPNEMNYINDVTVKDVLPLLLAGAEKDANCQFMLACVYAGRESMGASNPDYRYSFRNVEKAYYWIGRFRSNPNRGDAQCWGYSEEEKEAIINNILNLVQDRRIF